MIPAFDSQQETDSATLFHTLELELARERAAWKQKHAQRQTLRVASFIFLFVVIAGGLAAAFLAFNRISEQRASQPPSMATPAR